jgi:hypothetical protein
MLDDVSVSHLHWAVIMNGTMIDPEIFVKAQEE